MKMNDKVKEAPPIETPTMFQSFKMEERTHKDSILDVIYAQRTLHCCYKECVCRKGNCPLIKHPLRNGPCPPEMAQFAQRCLRKTSGSLQLEKGLYNPPIGSRLHYQNQALLCEPGYKQCSKSWSNPRVTVCQATQ